MEKKRFQFKEHPWISIVVLLVLYLVADVLRHAIRKVLKPDVQMTVAQDSVQEVKKEVIEGREDKGVSTDPGDAAGKPVQRLAAALKEKGVKGALTELRVVACKQAQRSAAAP